MIKARTYSAKGKKLEDIRLPRNFEEKQNDDLLAQAIHVYRARAHTGLSKTKTRGEVARTTRKWYRQKGTGRARHGARSAPIFVGGGKAHGPKGFKREVSLPKKMKQKALDIALSMKARSKQIVVVSGLSTLKKTKETAALIDKIRQKNDKRFTFALAEKNLAAQRVIRNLDSAKAVLYRNLNAYKVYFGGVLVLDKDIFGGNKK